MSLAEYQRKRDFEVTSEPRGRENPSAKGDRYLIQKHAATRLHYDLRLELDGVLKSWAVPKGPSYDPHERRLAVHVEDHPLDYGSFEGTIPKGEYGGGTVMMWDEGTWEPIGEAREGYAKGKLKFQVRGQKLQGAWTLVRMAGEDGKNWLLIKEKDERVRPHAEFDVTSLDRSVVSGRSMDEIASGAELQLDLPGALQASLPDSLGPMLASLAENIPTDDEWIHEIKYDGYRILAWLDGGEVKLITRGGQNWTDRFSGIAQALARLPLKSAILDGELVALKPDGTTDFQSLQNSLQGKSQDRLVYYVFDLPFWEGWDLRKTSLLNRKGIIQRLLLQNSDDLRYSDHILGHGPEVLANARQLALEGVISKRLDSHYESRRSSAWIKTKCTNSQEFVIGAFTDPSGGREEFGALLLGHYENDRLVFCGKVGTGFTQKSLKEIHDLLKPLRIAEPPFLNPPKGAQARGVHWVKPELVAQVTFMQWTDEGILRHPTFQGLRQDKPALQVIDQNPLPKSRPELQLSCVKISNPDRVIDLQTGLTKGELAEYYDFVSDRLLPHIAHRPLTVVRCPNGNQGTCFFQKHVKEGFPKSILSVPIEGDDGLENYIVIDSPEGLVSLVQLGAIEMHPWGSREDDLEKPDRLIFDLDPDPSVDWEQVTRAALEVRDYLAEIGLTSFCKTSGGKGLHVVVPLTGQAGWEDTKSFCQAIAEGMARLAPQRYVANMAKAKRKGKIFIDYLRNGRGATSASAYSVRCRDGSPISTPVDWSEVTPRLDPQLFNVKKWKQRVAEDLRVWKEFTTTRQSLTEEIQSRAQLVIS